MNQSTKGNNPFSMIKILKIILLGSVSFLILYLLDGNTEFSMFGLSKILTALILFGVAVLFVIMNFSRGKFTLPIDLFYKVFPVAVGITTFMVLKQPSFQIVFLYLVLMIIGIYQLKKQRAEG